MKYDRTKPLPEQLEAFYASPDKALTDIDLSDAPRLALLPSGVVVSVTPGDNTCFVEKTASFRPPRPATPAPTTTETETQVSLIELRFDEERLLRRLDRLRQEPTCDQRWLAIARTHFEEGFAALYRSAEPSRRISLPEDDGDAN